MSKFQQMKLGYTMWIFQKSLRCELRHTSDSTVHLTIPNFEKNIMDCNESLLGATCEFNT